MSPSNGCNSVAIVRVGGVRADGEQREFERLQRIFKRMSRERAADENADDPAKPERRSPSEIRPARKNAPSSSTHRYQTPWTNVPSAISTVASSSIHHFGGDAPNFCHSKSKRQQHREGHQIWPPQHHASGRPPPRASPAISVTSHASGRFSHGNADQPTRMNKATTEKITSDSAFQFVPKMNFFQQQIPAELVVNYVNRIQAPEFPTTVCRSPPWPRAATHRRPADSRS